MKKTPVSQVKERFESKDKLVAAVQKLATAELWSDRVNAAKGLGRVSNAKLVRLHDTLTDAKKRFGSRDKLISSIDFNMILFNFIYKFSLNTTFVCNS